MQGDADFVWVSHKQKERGRVANDSHCVSTVLVHKSSVESFAPYYKEHKNLHPESYQHCNSPAFVWVNRQRGAAETV